MPAPFGPFNRRRPRGTIAWLTVVVGLLVSLLGVAGAFTLVALLAKERLSAGDKTTTARRILPLAPTPPSQLATTIHVPSPPAAKPSAGESMCMANRIRPTAPSPPSQPAVRTRTRAPSLPKEKQSAGTGRRTSPPVSPGCIEPRGISNHEIHNPAWVSSPSMPRYG